MEKSEPSLVPLLGRVGNGWCWKGFGKASRPSLRKVEQRIAIWFSIATARCLISRKYMSTQHFTRLFRSSIISNSLNMGTTKYSWVSASKKCVTCIQCIQWVLLGNKAEWFTCYEVSESWKHAKTSHSRRFHFHGRSRIGRSLDRKSISGSLGLGRTYTTQKCPALFRWWKGYKSVVMTVVQPWIYRILLNCTL